MPGLGFLGVIEVFALVTQPPGQLMHDFFEDHAVNILAKHVEEEPITHLALLNKGVDHFTFDQSESYIEQVSSHSGRYHYHHSVCHHQGRQEGEKQKPKPEEDVNFFIDYI